MVPQVHREIRVRLALQEQLVLKVYRVLQVSQGLLVLKEKQAHKASKALLALLVQRVPLVPLVKPVLKAIRVLQVPLVQLVPKEFKVHRV